MSDSIWTPRKESFIQGVAQAEDMTTEEWLLKAMTLCPVCVLPIPLCKCDPLMEED